MPYNRLIEAHEHKCREEGRTLKSNMRGYHLTVLEAIGASLGTLAALSKIGLGIIWQLDKHNQLNLDYEASFGDKYDKPWGLTAGYRYQF